MCGIAGYFGPRGAIREDQTILRRMTASLTHRGPDSDGYFVNSECALGVRRLAIVDPAGGDQPLYNEDRSLALVCNGEIFNYPELRLALERRHHRLRTRCDVEVILHLYEEYGVEMLHHLNGQFALALYDSARHSLLLARDHFGVAPLFFCVNGDVCVFGSEIKALLEHPLVGRDLNLVGLDQVLTFPGLVSPQTMFKDVQSLPGGHYLRLADGAVRTREYWDLNYPMRGEDVSAYDEATCREALDDLLVRSVRRRMQADVPVGFYLSGGLDSSLIGAVINSVSCGAGRHSFSVSFQDPLISEQRFQRLAADCLRSNHHEIPFDTDAIASRLEDAVYYSEMPLRETYNTCSLALSECASRHGVKVVLSGEGADEFLAGYIGYRFDQHGCRGHARDRLEEAREEELRLRMWGDANLFYEIERRDLAELKTALYSSTLSEQQAEFDCTAAPVVNTARLAGRHPLHQRSYLDFKLRLSDHLISDHGDRMAMAHSVEARFAFLDVELVEFLTRVPPELKLRAQQDKYLLRKVAERWLPAEIVTREKFGFHAPGLPTLLQERHPAVHDLLSCERIRRQGYFDADVVEGLKARYATPGFRLNLPHEPDVLAIVLTFGILLDTYRLPSLA